MTIPDAAQQVRDSVADMRAAARAAGTDQERDALTRAADRAERIIPDVESTVGIITEKERRVTARREAASTVERSDLPSELVDALLVLTDAPRKDA